MKRQPDDDENNDDEEREGDAHSIPHLILYPFAIFGFVTLVLLLTQATPALAPVTTSCPVILSVDAPNAQVTLTSNSNSSDFRELIPCVFNQTRVTCEFENTRCD